MAKKLPEWFEEYNKASVKQNQYLSRVGDLRRCFKTKDMHPLMVNIERKRHLMGRLREPTAPSMKKMEQKVILFGPKPFPVRTTGSMEKLNKFQMTPTVLPRNLQPIVRGRNFNRDLTSSRSDPDLQTIATVAARNKLASSGRNRQHNLTPSHALTKSNDRKVLPVSRVSVKESLTRVYKGSHMDYITDVSQRKDLISNSWK